MSFPAQRQTCVLNSHACPSFTGLAPKLTEKSWTCFEVPHHGWYDDCVLRRQKCREYKDGAAVLCYHWFPYILLWGWPLARCWSFDTKGAQASWFRGSKRFEYLCPCHKVVHQIHQRCDKCAYNAPCYNNFHHGPHVWFAWISMSNANASGNSVQTVTHLPGWVDDRRDVTSRDVAISYCVFTICYMTLT